MFSIEIKLVKKGEEGLISDISPYLKTTEGYYVISNKYSEKVLDCNGANIVNKKSVVLNDKTDNIGQIWKIQYLKDDNILIKPASNTNVCLSNIDIKLYKCNYSDDQLWKLKDLNDGFYNIYDNSETNILFGENIKKYSDDDLGKFKLISYNDVKKYRGIDVSKWQGSINWTLFETEIPEFIIMRIGSGRNNYEKDSKFTEYYQKCKELGIPIGVYFYSFAKNLNEALIESNFALEWLDGRKIELPIFYDIENISQTLLGKEVLTKIAETFCENIMENGYHCGIYANKYFLQDNLYADVLSLKYPIWLAHYTGSNNYDDVLNNKFYTDYSLTPFKFWQFSSLGVYKSITENTVDLDLGYDIFD